MLPGFRFLFAAIMLSMSLLIFGLGAAALLRAAHESFASNSTWRGSPEVPFAQIPETTLPMLATLRIEPVAVNGPDAPKVAPAPAEPAPAITEPAGKDQIAALKPAEAPPAEIAKPAEVVPAPKPTAENQPVPAILPPATLPTMPPAATATTDETRTATVETYETTANKSEPVMAQPEAVAPAPIAPVPAGSVPTEATSLAPGTTEAPATAPETNGAPARIATLGGPPVDVTDTDAGSPTVTSVRARFYPGAIRKRVQARRALRRRRFAARARFGTQQQLQANPFGQQPQSFAPAASATR